MNPIHASINNPRLFRGDGDGKFLDDHGLKCGYSRARIVEEIPLPQVTLVNRVAFGIFCALEVCNDAGFTEWASDWLENRDRSEKRARAAWEAASEAARAAARAAAKDHFDLPAIAKAAMEIT